MVVGFTTMCNQCPPPPKLWVPIQLMVRCTPYNIMWTSLSVINDRSVVFRGYSGFLHQYIWPPWYSWNIVESGGKHHKPNQASFLSNRSHFCVLFQSPYFWSPHILGHASHFLIFFSILSDIMRLTLSNWLLSYKFLQTGRSMSTCFLISVLIAIQSLLWNYF